MLGKWKLGSREWEFRPDGYVTGTLVGARLFRDPDYRGRGYKLRYTVNKDGKDSATVTLTVMELHTNREASAKATVKFSGDQIEFSYDGKPSQLAAIGMTTNKPLTRVRDEK